MTILAHLETIQWWWYWWRWPFPWKPPRFWPTWWPGIIIYITCLIKTSPKVLAHLVTIRYSPPSWRPLHWLSLVAALSGVALLLLSRGHYSIGQYSCKYSWPSSLALLYWLVFLQIILAIIFGIILLVSIPAQAHLGHHLDHHLGLYSIILKRSAGILL